MSNQERSMRWWPNIAFPIVSRPAQTFSVLISKKSWSGRAEKTISLLSEMSVDVPKPRALDASAANVCADRRRKTKAPPFVLPFYPRHQGYAAPRSVRGTAKAKPPERGNEL